MPQTTQKRKRGRPSLVHAAAESLRTTIFHQACGFTPRRCLRAPSSSRRWTKTARSTSLPGRTRQKDTQKFRRSKSSEKAKYDRCGPAVRYGTQWAPALPSTGLYSAICYGLTQIDLWRLVIGNSTKELTLPSLSDTVSAFGLAVSLPSATHHSFQRNRRVITNVPWFT